MAILMLTSLFIALAAITLQIRAAGELVLPERDNLIASLPVWKDESSYRRGVYIYRTADPVEFVIAWPANTDLPKNPDSRLVIDRFRLLNESRPSISAEVSVRPEDHLYTYSYRVTNGGGARKPIWHWALIDPYEDTGADISNFGLGHEGFRVNGMPPGQKQVIPGVLPGVFIVWANARNPIRPGTDRSGFTVTSDFLPGLTTAAFSTLGGIATSEELPIAVSDQLLPFEQPELTDQLRITIGPRFPSSTSHSQWAGAFARDIRALETVMPDLSRSKFIPRLLVILDACSKGGPCHAAPEISGAAVLPLESEMNRAVDVVLGNL
jgi:hypothetical protein